MSKFSIKSTALAVAIGGLIATADSASAALNLPTQNCSFNFTANLKLGSVHPEVKMLQQVLNYYPQTQVSVSGPGSPGMETTTFGAKTRLAVIKFQELHPVDILAPIGATKGTGNVFSLTRNVLNQICVPFTMVPTSTVPTSTPVTPVTAPVTVSLASVQPMTVLVQGQAAAKLADFVFNGNGTVNNVTLMRSGVSTNNTLTNVYLYDGMMRVAGPASVASNGSITFNSPTGLFTVSGSRMLSVRADIATGTSGQSVGVVLTGMTVQGESPTSANLAGPQLPIANVNLATVAMNSTAPSPASTTIQAGTMNQTVWSQNVSVGTRAVHLKSMAMRMIGSAPVSAVNNVRLVVNGAVVATGVVDASGYVSFVPSTSNTLNTGSHTVEVRLDVVGGASRNFYFVLENAGDAMFEDSNLPGVNVTPTYSSQPVVNLQGGLVTIQSCGNMSSCLTVSQNSVSNNTILGGASNVRLGSFKLQAFGEDVKVTNLNVGINGSSLLPAANVGLNNVALYVNGAQVGSTQNITAALPQVVNFNNLGTNLTVQVGQPVNLEVRADIVANNNSAAYTSGTLQATMTIPVGGVQGLSSFNLNTSAINSTGQIFSISSGTASFFKAPAFVGGTTTPGTQNVKIGSFTLQAGSAEGVVLNNIAVTLGGTIAASNVQNLTVKDGSNVVGNVIGSPVLPGVNNFSVNSLNIAANSSKTFDIFADINSAAMSGNTITANAQATYHGAVSNLSTTSPVATGVTTAVALGNLGLAVVSPTSDEVTQYVVGGTMKKIMTIRASSTTGAPLTITEMWFDVNPFIIAGTYPVYTVTVVDGSNSQSVGVNSSNGKAQITGLNIAVPAIGNKNIVVEVDYSCFAQTANAGGKPCNISTSPATPHNVNVQLTDVKYNNGVNIIATSTTTINSQTMKLVASKPTVNVTQTNVSGLSNGSNKIGQVTITADAASDIEIKQIPVVITLAGGAAVTSGTEQLREGGVAVPGVLPYAAPTGFTLINPITITKGTSRTFEIYADITGVTGPAGTVSVSTKISPKNLFLWNDVGGGGPNLDGNDINDITNGFSNSYTIKN